MSVSVRGKQTKGTQKFEYDTSSLEHGGRDREPRDARSHCLFVFSSVTLQALKISQPCGGIIPNSIQRSTPSDDLSTILHMGPWLFPLLWH